MKFLIIKSLEHIKNDAEQVAREIYYAMMQLPKHHPSRANLIVALDLLGVSKPSDIGLSDRVLEKYSDEI